MSPFALIIGGGLAALLWFSSRRNDEPTKFKLEAGELYEVTLDIGGTDPEGVSDEISEAGGILHTDAPYGSIVFEMRPGVDLPVSVPGTLPGFGDEVVITEIRKVDE